jgi:hypothetical protein
MKRIFTVSGTQFTKTALFAVTALLVTTFISAQTLVAVYKETYPNTNNTSLSYPINTSYTGSIGDWSSYSTGKATISSFPAYYSPVTNALKFTSWSTAGIGASDNYATSPVIDLSNQGCFGKYDFVFKLYSYACTYNDNNSYLAVDYSADGGATWTVAWQKTSGQLYASYGSNGLNEIWLGLPNSYLTANFRYRFRTHMNANNANNFYIFIDEPTVYCYTCPDLMTIGDLVWLDANQNGVKEAAETGLPGITVQLLRDNDGDGLNDWDFTPLTTTTDANGKYKFSNIIPGNYLLGLINVNTSYRLVATHFGDPDENADNNNNGWYQSPDFTYIDGGWMTLLPQSEPTNDGDGNNGNLTYDFAVYQLSSLAVQSLHITTSLYNNTVTVNWKTVNEVNNSHFEIERSTDNNSFSAVATRVSDALAGGIMSYSIADNVTGITAKMIYYRIKLVDKQGKITYSNTVAVRLVTEEEKVTVWPNPFITTIKLSYSATANGEVMVRLNDVNGRTIKAQLYKVAKGANQLVMDNLDNLQAGFYTADIYNTKTNTRTTLKITK